MKTISKNKLESRKAQPGNGWYVIEAFGDFTHPYGEDGEIVQHLSPEVLGALAERPLPDGGVLVDRDHMSLDTEHTTEAVGWLKELAILPDVGLAGRIEWTAPGLELVRGRLYKHFSTVYPAPTPEERAAGVMEPQQIIGLALTNQPNNGNGQPPIANRGYDPLKNADTTNNTTTTMNPEILAELGLPENATDEEVLAAIRACKGAADDAAAAEADAIINSEEQAAGAELTDEEKQEAKEELVSNREHGKKYVHLLCQSKAGTATTNRRYAGNGKPTTNRKPNEVAVANRANEICKEAKTAGRKINWWQAKRQAEAELSRK